MVSRGQRKSIEESENDAALKEFNLVQQIYELLPPLPDMAQYQIFVQYQYQYFQKFGFQNQ